MALLFEKLPPQKFSAEVHHVLHSAPAQHQMLITCAHKALTQEYADDLTPIMFALRSAGSSVDGAIAFHDTPGGFRASLAGVVTREVADAVFAGLDDADRARVGSISLALGPLEAVESFAEAYSAEFCCQVTGRDFVSLLLDSAPSPAAVDGCLRAAEPGSAVLDTLGGWRGAFVEDAYGSSEDLPSQQENAEAVSKLVAEGDLFYWQVGAGVPVAMCCTARRLGAEGCSISLVFTDREHRGKGYASAMVSAFCEEKLKALKFVALFADPGSSFNTIPLYERVGFRRTGLHGERNFVRVAEA